MLYWLFKFQHIWCQQNIHWKKGLLYIFYFHIILHNFTYCNFWYKSAFYSNRYTLCHYKTHVSSLWTYTNEVVSSLYFCDKQLLMCDGVFLLLVVCVTMIQFVDGTKGITHLENCQLYFEQTINFHPFNAT